jgi:hypothetical protein
MRSNARNFITANFVTAIVLLGALLSGSSALAADYSIDFGAETSSGKDAGSLACVFAEACIAEMKSLGLRATISVYRNTPERALVYLYGYEPRIYYFDGAADTITLDMRKSLHAVPFFKGVAARGGLFIENERVGTLYIRFRSH